MLKVYFLMPVIFLCQTVSMTSQTAGLEAFSKYQGYDNSLKNGFLSHLSTNIPNKWNEKFENSKMQSGALYDYHGILGNSMNVPRAQCSDTQGNIYITGSSGNIENNSGDITTIKINAAGEIVWTLRIPSPEFTVNSGTQITIDSERFIYLAGYLWNQASTDIMAVKINNNGELIWKKIIGNQDSFDVPTAMTVNNLGEVYIAGITHHNEKTTYYISKINSSGLLIWENIEDDFPNETWNEPRIIHNDASGNIVVCGTGYDQDLKSKTVTAKFDANGSLIWKKIKTFNTTINNETVITDGWPTDFTMDNNGNIYVANNFAQEFNYSSLTLRYDFNSNESWNEIQQLEENDTQIKQIFFDQNLLFIGGYQTAFGEGGFLVSSLNLDGSLNWTQNSTDQFSPSQISISVQDNKVHLNSISFDVVTFGSLINTASYALDSGALINSSTFDVHNLELGFTINDFFHVLNSNKTKSIVLSTFYSQYGNVYEVINLDNLDNSTKWNTKFILQNSTKTNVLVSVSDSNSNVFSVLSTFYVTDGNLNSVSQKSYLAKHDVDGNFVSSILINDAEGVTTVGLAIDGSDNIVVMIKESQSAEIVLKKFTDTFQPLWNTGLTVNSLQNELIGIDSQNNICLVTAIESQISPFEISIQVSKFTSTGALLFSNIYQPENELLTNNFAGKLSFDENDNIIIGGASSLSSNSSTVPTLLNISSSGVANFFRDFPINDNSSSLVDMQLLNNDFYLALSSRNDLDDSYGIHIVKCDAQGQLLWQHEYFEVEKTIFLYKLLYSKNRDALYTVGFKGGLMGGNIEVVSWNLNGDIQESYVLEDNNFYQDAFSDSQYLYVLANNQSQINFPKRLLNWAGPFISSKVTKLNFDLSLAETIDFKGPNYSMFEPKQLIPLNNSNLLISGRLFHEELFFEGLQFFSIPYDPILSTPTFSDPQESIFYCYPNPTSDYAYLSPNEGIKEINVFDSIGKKIFSKTTSKGIDVSKLAKGVYLVKVTNDNNEVFTTKLVRN